VRQLIGRNAAPGAGFGGKQISPRLKTSQGASPDWRNQALRKLALFVRLKLGSVSVIEMLRQ
jgi:hypothetical protein